MVVWFVNFVDSVISLYSYIILARVFLSWVEPNPYNPVVQFIYNLTEPVLRPLRIVIKTGNIGFDLSPIIAFLLIQILRKGIYYLLYI